MDADVAPPPPPPAAAATPTGPTPPSTSKAEEPDHRASLRHVLVDSDPPPPRASSVNSLINQSPAGKPPQTPPSSSAVATPAIAPAPMPPPAPEIPSQGQNTSTPGTQGPQNLAAITYTLRKNANGGVSTVYSGSKIKYLKKDDGLPFWRRDIQYAFLYHVFQDKSRVFTKLSNGSSGHTFAEIYIDAMANSSKCSQILKEKLLAETSDQALDMAMVCLLVNVGRMNTTVNFFPEMRARVRTFHSIPCLQTHQSPQAYKQLQDGPRLKSILKGAMEDMPQPNNLEELANHVRPRTNPVSLIFVLAQYAPRISDLHFPAGTDFFDLFMRDTLSSKSRATALLWIVWWYLESDFSAEDSQRNPFGQGQPSNASDAMIEGLNVVKGVRMRVPEFEILSEEQAASENVDPPDELEYGETKRLEREAILASDALPLLSATQKRGVRSSEHQPYSSSGHMDDTSSTSMLEPQQGYRFHRNYSPSPTRSGDARGGMTPTPDGSFANDERMSRSQMRERGRTQSGTSPQTIDRHSSNGQHSKGTPEGEIRKGPGRGNYPRRIKAHSTQPFEQMYLPHQFKGTSGPTSGPPGFQYGSEPIGRPVLPSNSSGHAASPHAASPSNAHHQSPHSYYYPPNGHQPYQAQQTRGGPTNATTAAVLSERDPSNAATDQHPPMKRRAKAERHRAVEQTRNDRVTSIVNSNILALRRAKRRERKRRGVIVDAWIKARATQEYWDSEDDRYVERISGLDEIRTEGGLDIPILIAGGERKKARWNPGDIGLQASSIAKTWRKVARANGVDEIVERSRRRMRRTERHKERDYVDAEDDPSMMDVDSNDELDDHDHQHTTSAPAGHTPPTYPTSNFTHKNPTLAAAAASRSRKSEQSPSVIVVDDDDGATVTAEPTPKKKRRVGPRRQKGSATTRGGDDEPNGLPRGPRGGMARVSLSGRGRKRRSIENSSTAAAAAEESTKDEKAPSQPGSFAWFRDAGEKMEADIGKPFEADGKNGTEGEDETMADGEDTTGQGPVDEENVVHVDDA